MAPHTGSKFYLDNGRLDLSSLNEEIPVIKQGDPIIQITDQELMNLQENNTLAALEEMALMFEIEDGLVEDHKVPRDLPVKIEDEFTKAFNEKRLQEEMQEFGIKD